MGDEDDGLTPSIAKAIVSSAEQAGVGIAITQMVGGTLIPSFINRAATQILGRSREELFARGGLENLKESERAPVVDRVRRRAAGESFAAFETTVVHGDGREVPVHCATGAIAIDGKPSFVSFFQDVSTRRDAERIREASETRLRTLVEVAPDCIVVTRDGAIVFINTAGARILGVEDPTSLVGRPLANILSPAELAVGSERLAAAQPDHLLPMRVYEVRSDEGKTMTVEATSLAIEWDGEPALLTFGRDITDRIAMEAQLARADRLAALGTLAAGVAHEINNPLAYVSLGLESLERLTQALPEAERQRAVALLEDLGAGLGRVAAITRDLRTFAQEQEEEPEASSDLATVLAAVERLVAHAMKQRAELVVDLPPSMPRVRGGALRLEQVFVNLVLNAAQSFEEATASPHVTVRGRVDGARALIDVIDNGPGMSPETRARIFEPFFTTKPPGLGTGLGLAISQTIIRDVDGSLDVTSSLGQGTTFRVTLPLASEAREAEAPSAPVVRRARILVVDDEPAIVRSLGALLASTHEVAVLTSGKEALAALLGGVPYDVVLCDLMMPHVTGMDLYEQLSRERPGEEAKLVFMTGGAFTDQARRFLATIPNRRIEKPFPFAELERAIGELLG